MCKVEFLLCPVCKNKTRIKLRPDTVLENFPLFCPKCKQETLISVKDMKVSALMDAGRGKSYWWYTLGKGS